MRRFTRFSFIVMVIFTISIAATYHALADSEEEFSVEQFIERFNEFSEIQITNIFPIDISRGSDYYRTEFRLYAFEKSVAFHASLGQASMDIVHYDLDSWFGTQFRIYAYFNSEEDAQHFLNTYVEVFDLNITDVELQELYQNWIMWGSSSFNLNGITGTISNLSPFGNYEMMLDIGDPELVSIDTDLN